MTYEMELLVRHNDGIREGIAIGREEGLSAGRKENSQKIALSMLKKGLPVPLISECTSLTEQEIDDLAKKHDLL